MALRIRRDGRILCAAMHAEEPGDTYIHDGLHYTLSVEEKVICSESWDGGHSEHGEWWWVGNVPEDVEIERYDERTRKQGAGEGERHEEA
jgi:hypothetical protein